MENTLIIEGTPPPKPSSPELFKSALAKASALQRISPEEARALWEHADLTTLGDLAQKRRRHANPGPLATFLIDRNINYTNVCNSDCSFCGFYRHDPKHPEAYVISREVLSKKIEEAIEHGATRILLQGGHNDELPYSYYPELISWIHRSYPTIEINCFSPSEIDQMQKISGKDVRSILSELQAAGMSSLPGGGAEILDDEIRKRVSPKKISAGRWIEIMEVAQQIRLSTTATMVFGFGEEIRHRINHFSRLRDLQDKSLAIGSQGFCAFICWPLQHNENTSLGRSRHAAKYGGNALEYLRVAALGRIFLDNIQHHQASWPTLGGDVAQIGLHFGCDDIGSTMMEENVVSQAGAPTKQRWSMTAEELKEYIRDAGFTPAQRDASFRVIREY